MDAAHLIKIEEILIDTEVGPFLSDNFLNNHPDITLPNQGVCSKFSAIITESGKW